MIVDTHVHVVTNDRARYPQLADTPRAGSIPSIAEIGQTEWPLTTAEILIDEMDRAGVAKATLVQAYFVYEYDNRYVVNSAAAHPDRFVPIVTLDPIDPAAPDKLSALVEQGARGIRFMRGRLPRCTLGEPETHGLWQRIAALRIPLSVHDKVEELVRLPPMLERFPEITVALDHGWGHKVGEPPYDLLKSAVRPRALSQCPGQDRDQQHRGRARQSEHTTNLLHEAGRGLRRKPHHVVVQLPGTSTLREHRKPPCHSPGGARLPGRAVPQRDFRRDGTDGLALAAVAPWAPIRSGGFVMVP